MNNNGSRMETPLSTEDPKDVKALKSSKRTRAILIVAIVILIAVIGIIGYFGYNLYQSANQKGQTGIASSTSMTDSSIVDTTAPETIVYKKTSIPNLTDLFGETTDEASATLGSGFQLTKLDNVTDDSNADITQLATYSFTPTIDSGNPDNASTALAPTESVYASLNSDGQIIDVYYICDLSLLDVPESSFDDLLSSDWLVTNTLQTAGVTPLDYSYEVPDPDSCIVYDNPNSQNRLIVKQSQIFSGRTSSETLPTAWTLTVTYDFGSGVTTGDDYSQAVRTINLKLA